MKIITILLLMISTQAQALGIDTTAPGAFSVKQCNQIANISKRTIKAAIIGVPIAEVINKFTVELDGVPGQFKDDSDLENITIADSPHHSLASGITTHGDSGGAVRGWVDDPGVVIGTNTGLTQGGNNPNPVPKITAIYKTVDQIKTKYGQVRPQDRVRLNNRVEQNLMECQSAPIWQAGCWDSSC